jgi:hypothetical protein
VKTIAIFGMLLSATAANAGTWQCVDTTDRHTYLSSQNVYSDQCVLVSDANPYAASRGSDADLQAAMIPRKAKAPSKPAVKRPGASIGMSKDEAIASSWGRPESVNRTTNAYGTREQWVYGGGNYLYFENGVLTSIQN